MTPKDTLEITTLLFTPTSSAGGTLPVDPLRVGVVDGCTAPERALAGSGAPVVVLPVNRYRGRTVRGKED